MERLRLHPLALLAFAVGASEPFTVEVLGRIYLVELLLPMLALVLLATRSTEKLRASAVFRTLVAMLLVLIASYMISDVIRGTTPDQYLRGWGRALFVLTTLAALSILAAVDRRLLWWLVLGIGIGGVLHARFGLHLPLRSHYTWKFEYAPHVLLAASALAGLVPARLAAIGMGMLGVYGMTLEGRSYSALAFCIAGLLWIRSPRSAAQRVRGLSKVKLALGVVVVAAAVAGLAALTTNEWTSQRRAQSDENRFALLSIGPRVIAGSPLIGYGSWAQNPEIAQVAAEVLGTQSVLYRDYMSSGSTLMHSQILQAWVEGGLGAGLFFVVYAALALWSLKYVVLDRPRDSMSAMLAYLCLNGLWHLFMSPFAATNRLDIGLALGAIVLVALERGAIRRGGHGQPRVAAPVRDLPAAAARVVPARPRRIRPARVRANPISRSETT